MNKDLTKEEMLLGLKRAYQLSREILAPGSEAEKLLELRAILTDVNNSLNNTKIPLKKTRELVAVPENGHPLSNLVPLT